MTRSSTRELFTPFENPERVFRSKRRLFETHGLVESSSPEFDFFSDIKERSEEEATEIMTETIEQYMSKTRENYGSGVARPKINNKTHFELKGQFLKELAKNTFSGSENKDTNEHIEKVLEIVDLFHILEVTQDQIRLRAFPMSLTGVALRWLRNEPSGSITNWETLKSKFLNKYCPPARIAKKMEEINNFQQEPDESLFRAWERFKELLMKCPQHYLTGMQEVILFYNGVDIPTRQILDSKGVIPTKTVADAKVAIQDMAEYSQKWHNGTSTKTRSMETSDGLAAIQAQLNSLGRKIKKVNKKATATVGSCPRWSVTTVETMGLAAATATVAAKWVAKITTTPLRMIAETDPTRREEALTAYGTKTGQGLVPVPKTVLTVCTTRLRGQLHTILEDMDRYPNAYLEELEAFLTLWDMKPRVEESLLETLSVDELITQLRQVCKDAEDRASNAQEEARQKRKEALEEVVQQIYRNNN
ncbi:ribonuclease H-like domain-containing protein [Tanacetum coccineum]